METPKRQQFLVAELAGAVLRKPERGKQHERDCLNQLFRWLGWSEVAIEDRECPDFMFSLDVNGCSICIGCELTDLFVRVAHDPVGMGSVEARFRSQWFSFATRLKETLASSNEPLGRTYGAIHFRNPTYEVLDHLNPEKLINEIVQLLEDSPPLEVLDKFCGSSYPTLCAHVDHIWTASVVDECPLWWAAHLRSGIGRDPTQTIIKTVAEKSRKAQMYEWPDTGQRWLVIVAPGLGIRDNVPWYSGKSYITTEKDIPFSHVFFFAWGIGDWYVLQLHPEITIISKGSRLSSVK